MTVCPLPLRPAALPPPHPITFHSVATLVVLLALTVVGCSEPLRDGDRIVWRTFLPLEYGDAPGTAVPAEVHEALLRQIVTQFGGCTTRPGVIGYWRDPDTGELVVDRQIEVEVVCAARQRNVAEQLTLEIGRTLRQKAVYFEVRTADVQIIETVPTSGLGAPWWPFNRTE